MSSQGQRYAWQASVACLEQKASFPTCVGLYPRVVGGRPVLRFQAWSWWGGSELGSGRQSPDGPGAGPSLSLGYLAVPNRATLGLEVYWQHARILHVLACCVVPQRDSLVDEESLWLKDDLRKFIGPVLSSPVPGRLWVLLSLNSYSFRRKPGSSAGVPSVWGEPRGVEKQSSRLPPSPCSIFALALVCSALSRTTWSHYCIFPHSAWVPGVRKIGPLPYSPGAW